MEEGGGGQPSKREAEVMSSPKTRKFTKSPMKVCAMPSEISAGQLFLKVADAFTGVRFRYERFFLFFFLNLAVTEPRSLARQKTTTAAAV